MILASRSIIHSEKQESAYHLIRPLGFASHRCCLRLTGLSEKQGSGCWNPLLLSAMLPKGAQRDWFWSPPVWIGPRVRALNHTKALTNGELSPTHHLNRTCLLQGVEAQRHRPLRDRAQQRPAFRLPAPG